MVRNVTNEVIIQKVISLKAYGACQWFVMMGESHKNPHLKATESLQAYQSALTASLISVNCEFYRKTQTIENLSVSDENQIQWYFLYLCTSWHVI